MQDLAIFDCDTSYGRGERALPREFDTQADLLAELDHSGIGRALVWHRDAFERDFAAGNARIVREIARNPQRLAPIFHFTPCCCPEMPAPGDFLAQMRAADARVAQTFPTRYCFCVDPLSCGDLFDLFAQRNIPVMLPLPEIQGGWQKVYDVLRDFPGLTLILTRTGCWGEDRYFRPLLKRYERFHITTDRLETAGQLEALVNDCGHHQILFASGLPRNYAGGYIMMLARADIPDGARDAIAHANLERLLEEAHP